MANKERSCGDFLTSTVRVHAVHETEQNARIMHACVQQRAVHNRCIEHLLEHRSDEPLQKNTGKNVIGLYGYWPAWRDEDPALHEIPLLVARGAIAAAADQVAKWETTNQEHAVLTARAVEDGKPIPRKVQRRNPDQAQLWRRRKDEEREGRHRCRIDEKVRRVGRRTLQVPGIGLIRTKDDIPNDIDIRSCVILERTPKTRLSTKPDAPERSFKVHASGRKAKPALKSPETPGRTGGLDHGVVHALTFVDDNEHVETFDHDIDTALRAQRRLKKLDRSISKCRLRSHTWKRRQALKRSVRGKLCNSRRHRRRTWANHLAHRCDTVCVEKLSARNMSASAKGTSEAPGTNVKAKSGLNRNLRGVAPAEQTAILIRAGQRTGTRIELVPAQNTSKCCNACGYTHRKNRESQARFQCRSCGHTDNADANAARNVRDRGAAAIRARMDASREGGDHLPKGTDAGRKTVRQEQSRRSGKPVPPERTPSQGRSRFQHSHDETDDTGILAARQNTGILA